MFPMTHHRDRRELSAKILELISFGEKIPFNIYIKIGTNYKISQEILKNLTDSGLVSCTEKSKRFREYTITEKGSKFLRSFKLMEEAMTSP